MNAISYGELRSNPRKVMDMVCDTHEPVIILRKDGEKAVMLSYADYSAIRETLYLLGSPKMAARLRESIESFRKGTGVERALIEELGRETEESNWEKISAALEKVDALNLPGRTHEEILSELRAFRETE